MTSPVVRGTVLVVPLEIAAQTFCGEGLRHFSSTDRRLASRSTVSDLTDWPRRDHFRAGLLAEFLKVLAKQRRKLCCRFAIRVRIGPGFGRL